MTTKSKGESVRQKLTNLSAKMSIKYSNLETSFLIERLVARLIADKSLRQHLVFKGGFVGLKVYDSPRYTVDLDALLVKSNIEATLKLTKECAQSDLDDGVWFRYEGQIDLATQGEYGGIRQVYRAGIGEVLKNIKKAQIVHFDLGIGDPITPAPSNVLTPSLISQNKDLSWFVYPVETIIAEKLHSLVAHGDTNSRSKDVYDLCLFLPKADINFVKVALEKCFHYRETELPTNLSESLGKLNTARLKRGWPTAIASIQNAISFDEAFESLLEEVSKI